MEIEQNESIRILGAGISGLSAAITLKNNGYRTTVFEKKSHPGGRFIRDFQCLRNFGNKNIDPIKELKELGIFIKSYKKLMRIVRYSRLYSFEVISDNKPIYYLVLRGKNKNSIDTQLANYALKIGVNIVYNTKLNIDEADIVAKGPQKSDIFAYGELYQDVDINDTGYVFLDMKYSPTGYLYVLPGEKKGEIEIVNATYDSTVNIRKLRILYHKAIRENIILKNMLNGATKITETRGIGCCTLLNKPYQNNKYYVGEAAGLQDVTAGFGIRYAIISGYLAAKSIISNQDYEKQIVKTFKSQMDFEIKRSKNFKKLTNVTLDKIFKSINQKFGHELTIEEYESLRGVI